MAFVFRADRENVGDWWSPPFRYFPLKPANVYDLIDDTQAFVSEEVLVVGGGGLGTDFFLGHIGRLKRANRNYKLIAWGVGVDEVRDKSTILNSSDKYELFGNWFEGFDEVGTRCFSENQRYRWVPCASCMLPAFFRLRERKPDRLIGIYSHTKVPLHINSSENNMLVSNNNGNNIVEKLEFVARHEFIVTNTYHGVYWATLLNRKVICLPYKSGLFSFRHKPLYLTALKIDDEALSSAQSYPNSLEECRKANIAYYSYLTEKYGDI